MLYAYRCNKTKENRCVLRDWQGKDDRKIAFYCSFDDEGQPELDEPLTWEVSHGMTEEPEIKCPICKQVAYRVILSTNFYFRGNCYLDKAGCQRDMNIHKLQNEDPYGHMRQPGEVDDMIGRLKKAGTKRGKAESSRKYYPS